MRTGIGPALLLIQACLVTNKVDFDQPIIPSEVIRIDPRPDEFVRVPPEADDVCVEEGRHMRFGVRVSDLNREEDLELRIVINGVGEDQLTLFSSNELVREDFHFCLREDQLRQGCSLLEVLVSSRFSGSRTQPYLTRFAGDLSSTHWWVLGSAADNPSASLLDCPGASPDAGSL